MKRTRSPGRLFLASAACATLGCGDGRQVVLGGVPALDAGTELGAFGPPVLVPELAAAGFDDFKETLRGDLLEIYFCSTRPGGPGNWDVWSATRARASDPWGAPGLVAEVSSSSRETGTALSAEGLTLWLASDRPGGKGGFDIYVSTRPSRMAPWSTPAPVAELNTTSDEFPRAPAESALVMPPSYAFTKYQYQTFLTSRPNAGAPWTKPASLSEVDTANIDTDAFLTQDGLVLYFSSDRIVVGDQDLFVTSRPDPGSPFGSSKPVSELNVAGYQDRDPWLSPDGREMYFASDRSGTLKIYRATR
jgi:hypothetical protein